MLSASNHRCGEQVQESKNPPMKLFRQHPSVDFFVW